MISRRRLMHGNQLHGRVIVDQLEWQNADHADIAWDMQACYGGDIGVHWVRRFGETADLASDDSKTRFVAGVRGWF